MPPLKDFRHELFCQEYLKDRNGARAAQAAGYNAKGWESGKSSSASVQGYVLLKKPQVRNRLKELEMIERERLERTRERTLRELGRVAFSDIRTVVDDDGAIKSPKDWSDAAAAAVAGLETEALYEGHGRDRKKVGTTTKVKLWDKNQALVTLAKHFKILEADTNAATINNTLIQYQFHLPSNGRDPQLRLNGHGDEHEPDGSTTASED
jgi:phage terminase small subunit